MKQIQKPPHGPSRQTGKSTRGATNEAHEEALRARVREVLEAGRLPNRDPDRTWGGPGSGFECAICGAAVAQHEIELEIEFSSADGLSPVRTHRVHTQCFDAWESERQQVDAAGGALYRNGRRSLRRS